MNIKKFILFFLLISILFSYSFAFIIGDFNMRFGADLKGKIILEEKEEEENNKKLDLKLTGGAISFEYLFNMFDLFKVGPGIEGNVFEENYENKSDRISNSFIVYIPVYLFFQINPIKLSILKEFFIRGNIGKNMYVFQIDTESSIKAIGNNNKTEYDYKGDIYYAGGIGYKLPFALFFDLTYSIYNIYKSKSKFYDYDNYEEIKIKKLLMFNVGFSI